MTPSGSAGIVEGMRDTNPHSIQAHDVRHGMIIATPAGRSAVRDIKRYTTYPLGMRAQNKIDLTTANGETQTFDFYALVDLDGPADPFTGLETTEACRQGRVRR